MGPVITRSGVVNESTLPNERPWLAADPVDRPPSCMRLGADPPASLLESVPVLDSSGVPPLSRPATRALADAGLHFVGYVSPLTGHLREIGLRARWVARAIAAEPR